MKKILLSLLFVFAGSSTVAQQMPGVGACKKAIKSLKDKSETISRKVEITQVGKKVEAVLNEFMAICGHSIGTTLDTDDRDIIVCALRLFEDMISKYINLISDPGIDEKKKLEIEKEMKELIVKLQPMIIAFSQLTQENVLTTEKEKEEENKKLMCKLVFDWIKQLRQGLEAADNK